MKRGIILLLIVVVIIGAITLVMVNSKKGNDQSVIQKDNVELKKEENTKQTVSVVSEFIGMDTDEGYFIDEYTGSAKIIIVPDELDGKPVVGFDIDAFHNVDFEEMFLPKGMKKIQKATFANRVNLKKVTLNDGLKEIGYNTFINCTGLTEINIPSSVTVIGDAAFCGCTSLKKITLNEGIKKIGYTAFGGCAIETIILPASLEEIGDKAISGCNNLKEIKFLGSNTNIDESLVRRCPNAKVYGYAGSTAEQFAIYNGIPFITINENISEAESNNTTEINTFENNNTVEVNSIQNNM